MTSLMAGEELLKQDALGRVHVPVERREAILAEFERSGVSATEFARLTGIKYQTFCCWVQKHRKKQRRGSEASLAEPRREGDCGATGAKVRLIEAVVEGGKSSGAGGVSLVVEDRGDRQEAIFRDESDRERFLVTLGQACERTGWRVHAFVLMTNHYHLLVETPQPNLVAGMRWFQTSYTVRFNRRHRLTGHLFQGRYKAVVVDPQEREYFVTLSDYIHLNPVRARLISVQERPFDYRWSSYCFYVAKKGRPKWFDPGRVLGELGLEDTSEGRRRYAERMRERAIEELSDHNAAQNAELRRGWCLGGASFRERVLGLIEAAGEKFSKAREVDSAVKRSYDEEEARQLLRVAMAHFRIGDGDLVKLRRNDPRKLAIARVIRGRTSVPNQWIARELSLGHVSSVSRYCSSDADESEFYRELSNWLRAKKLC